MGLNRIPENTGGEQYLRVVSIQVKAWGPEQDGRGPCTHVVVEMTARGCPYPVLMWLAPGDVDDLADKLREVRWAAFPGAPEHGGE